MTLLYYAVIALAALLLFAVSGLHVYWALGGRWGASAALPEFSGSRGPVFIPGRTATLAVAALTAAAGCLLLLTGFGAGLAWPPLFHTAVHLGSWGCAAAMGARTLGDFRYFGWFKRVKGTRFARLDTMLYTPLCLFLCAAFIWGLLGQQP